MVANDNTPESFEVPAEPDLSDGMYCEHQRMADSCEVCAYDKAKAAGRPVAPQLYADGGMTENEMTKAEPAPAVNDTTGSTSKGRKA